MTWLQWGDVWGSETDKLVNSQWNETIINNLIASPHVIFNVNPHANHVLSWWIILLLVWFNATMVIIKGGKITKGKFWMPSFWCFKQKINLRTTFSHHVFRSTIRKLHIQQSEFLDIPPKESKDQNLIVNYFLICFIHLIMEHFKSFSSSFFKTITKKYLGAVYFLPILLL